MKKQIIALFAAVLLMLSAVLPANAAASTTVTLNDNANLIPLNNERFLRQSLTDLEKEMNCNIAVVIDYDIPSSAEQRAMHYYNTHFAIKKEEYERGAHDWGAPNASDGYGYIILVLDAKNNEVGLFLSGRCKEFISKNALLKELEDAMDISCTQTVNRFIKLVREDYENEFKWRTYFVNASLNDLYRATTSLYGYFAAVGIIAGLITAYIFIHRRLSELRPTGTVTDPDLGVSFENGLFSPHIKNNWHT